MAAEGILLGPFTGGLNTASDPASVQDRDLTVCQNMELDLDGALRNRYPFEDLDVSMSVGSSRPYRLLGFYTAADGTHYLLASNGTSTTYYFNGTTWQTAATGLAAAAMVQYRDKAWLIADPSTTQTGGSWDPVNGFATVPGIPRGRTITVNKERLWVGPGTGVTTNGARLTYSEVGEPNKWPDTPGTPGGGYLNVSAGDGQNIVNVVVYFSDILIFKERSVYRFSFTANPAQGTVTRLSNTIGSSGTYCVGDYEGTLYILYDDKVYSLVNYNFVRVNIKLPLMSTNPTATLNEPFHLSIWNDRLIIGYYADTYVLNLRTDTWCTYKSDVVGFIGRFVPEPDSAFTVSRAFVMSNTFSEFKLYRISAEETIVSEPMECIARTKHFDYQSPSTFKKLFYWGADVISKVDTVGTAFPIVYALPVTWDDVAAYTWDDLNTWDRPLEQSIDIVDVADINSVVGERKFIKFIKALRFRQIYFEVKFETDGSLTQAPAKLFTLTTYVSDKQLVPKKVS